jgi:ElaB/YqjD/DUF883 family membrane-anchored ribosome-binding protein
LHLPLKIGSLPSQPHVIKPEIRIMEEMTQVTKEKLVADFRVVVADAEELLRATAGQAGDKMTDLRAKLQDHLYAAKQSLADAQAAVVEKTKAVARATDDYVHDNPWRSIGIAAGIGLVIGLLIGRR